METEQDNENNNSSHPNNDSDEYSDDSDEYSDEGEGEGERTGFLRTYPLADKTTSSKHQTTTTLFARAAMAIRRRRQRPGWDMNWLHKTLIPDGGLSIRGHVLIEAGGSNFATKLLKFIAYTFFSIGVVHVVVAHLFDDRDRALTVAAIWRYEADLIARDCLVFFVVGRLWEKNGIDHLAWMGTALLANVYFESQNFVWFLQHSVTLFQMHCIWPWELWVFALLLIVVAAALVGAHAAKAWRDRRLVHKLTEVGMCVLLFVVPVATSDYFHLHHWYAGWLMGMQFNYNVWWSRLAMAWCWGMYVNGIAVYGRDPVLTCEYAYFLSLDNRCPYMSCYIEGVHDANNTSVTEMVPVDWRNCSATDDFQP